MLERDTSKLERVKAPFPRDLVRRGGGDPPAQGTAVRVGRRLRRAGRDRAVGGVRPSGRRAPLPVRDQGLLHEAGSGAAGGRALRRRARAGRLRRDHRRRRAPRRLRPAARSASRSTTCRRRRSSGISICAASAACRTAASAWASSASSAGSAASSTCARRFLIRGCCTGLSVTPRCLSRPDKDWSWSGHCNE